MIDYFAIYCKFSCIDCIIYSSSALKGYCDKWVNMANICVIYSTSHQWEIDTISYQTQKAFEYYFRLDKKVIWLIP